MTSSYFINNKEIKLGELLQSFVTPDSRLSFMLRELSLFGYAALSKQLANNEIRLILADDDTPLTKRLAYTQPEEKLLNQLNQKELADAFLKWLIQSVQAKGISSNRLSTNTYHIDNNEPAFISGSLPLSAEGLGTIYSNQVAQAMGVRDVGMAGMQKQMFDAEWNNKESTYDIQESLTQAAAFLAKDQSPEAVYFLILYRLFQDLLITDRPVKTKTGFKNSLIWNKLYPFQQDGVLGVIDKLDRFNGCILADSVGLGKTFEALAVIKYYELRNDRVLVLAPKKLRENWTLYKQNDKRNILAVDRFGYDVLNHTDLTRERGVSGDINLETLNWGNYDLVVIDESHNFRNASIAGETHTRYSKLMDDIIRSGVKTKVLMLSATPVNNRLNDLKNQINFITEADNYALQDHGIANISETLKKAQTRFNQWLKRPEEVRTTDQLINTLNFDYFKILDLLTIARSRRHIEKYYQLNEAMGKFPERLKPINIKTDFDTANEFPSLKDINRQIEQLNLSTFAPLKYVRMEKRKDYEQKYDTKLKDGKSVFSQLDREKSLIGLIKVNMLKRLESSVHSFHLTTERLLQGVEQCIEQLEKHQIKDFAPIDILETDIESADLEDMLIGNKVKVLIQDMDSARWKYDLEEDKRLLIAIVNAARNVNSSRDEKLNKLRQQIDQKLLQPINEGNKKIIVFTAFADTAAYLYENLADWMLQKHGIYTGLVIGGSGNNKTNQKRLRPEFNELLTAFSPVSKEMQQSGLPMDAKLDLLIATDCISEGQNLQDADYLINYDIHWNPVRIIQRFGRIDRLGSTNDKIQLVNFWPNMELNDYINLEARVSGRMVLLDVSSTGEENVIDNTDAGKMRDLAYRKKQLEELQNNVMDLEDISGGLSITDLTLNDFKMDLQNYREHNQALLEQSPDGLYSVVELDKTLIESGYREGVIFCVKSHAQAANSQQEPYALFPYYLVYVDQQQQIVLSNNDVKKILDILKRQSLGNKHADKALFRKVGKSSQYQHLLQAGMSHIQGVKQEQGVNSIFQRGGTQLNQSQQQDDFSVVAYLFLVNA